MKVFWGGIGGGVALLLIASPALVEAAGTNIYYGDRVGTSITYSNIFEYSGSDPTPLYGSPIISGNSLIFNNMTFSALATNGSSKITDGQINFDIHSNGSVGQWIDELQFKELGDTTLAGTGTANTYTMPAIAVDLTIEAVDFSPFADFFNQFYQTNVVFAKFTLPPPTSEDWNGMLTIDLASYLASVGYPDEHVTEVSVVSDNTLSAGSEPGTEAFIAKKVEGLQVTAMSIPEPSTLCLLVLSGTLLLIGRFNRKT
ncbi:MAG TPA: hypothetical protein VMV72_10045 [Verrucomicrobiae bacterium]|nr:hypothetical protein [Verrucomicrobiae bacterium]